MTREQFEREKMFQVTLSIAKSMRQKGLISESEFRRINELMLKKYQPLLGSLHC